MTTHGHGHGECQHQTKQGAHTHKQSNVPAPMVCQKWIGWEGEIYLAEMGAKGGIQARNFAYKPIIVEGDERDLGKFIKARIVEAKGTYFLGEIIE